MAPSQAADEKPAEGEHTGSETRPESSDASSAAESAPPERPPPSNIFPRLQTSLPPTSTPAALLSRLPRHSLEDLQQSLHLENANADFAQLRTTLAANI